MTCIRTTVLAMLSLSALCAFYGCRNGGGENADRNGKIVYEPQNNEVDVIVLQKKPFVRQLTANGRLSAIAKASMDFHAAGIVRGIYAENGDRVGAGDTIAVQENMDKALAVETARIALEKSVLDLYDVLAGQGYPAGDTTGVPRDVMRMARMRSGYDASAVGLSQAEIEYKGTVLTAPFAGKVADITLKDYDRSGKEAFCTLIDDSFFDVEFSILESEYSFMEKGLPVRIYPFSDSGKAISGKIRSINPKVGKNGQVSVRARVENDGSLIDGMNVRVLVERRMPETLVVPRSAVVIRDNLEVLFRYRNGHAVWTYVNVLMSNGEEHSVTANTDRGATLSAGDTVIVSGNLNLADGSAVVIRKRD